MLQFQQMMSRFLEVQQQVMLAYLGSDSGDKTALVEQSQKPVGTRPESALAGQEAAAAIPASVETPEESEVELPRFLLTAVDSPPSNERPLKIPPDSVILITDEGRGIAQNIADKLQSLGGRVALVQMGDEVKETSQGLYTGDLTDPEATAKLLELVRRRQGTIAGIMHLLPLKGGASFEEMSLGEWQERLRLEAKSLFFLAKAAGKDLKKAAESGVGWLISATAMGGCFAADRDKSPSFFPGQGAVVGLVKTLALEWPGVRCKAVDLDPEEPAEGLANHLVREIASVDGEVEVGYQGLRRLILRVSKMPLDEGRPASLAMDSSWVVVVTGGARGIAAEVALELAECYRPTLLLVGRSPLPEGQEGPETVGLTSPRELKAALIERMRRDNERVTPAQVEASYARLCQEREMRSNLAAMQQAGARVHYYQVDACDEQAFGQFIETVYSNHGGLDLFIHGAGIIQDKLIEHKTPESFDRVFDTKADSAFILSHKLRGESLKGLVFFSSMASRFGNPGQSDYAAANEVLNKLSVYLDRLWPGRVVAFNWGPWEKTGMVTPQVRRQSMERGIQLIQPSAGRQMVAKELRYGKKGEVELLIARGPWETTGYTIDPSSYSNVLPLLENTPLRSTDNGAIETTFKLDITQDCYLEDHRLDGKPVFPFAMAMELMAEVAQRGWPELKFMSIHNLRLLKGIVLEGQSQEVRVSARPKTNLSQKDAGQEVDVEITSLNSPEQVFYRATVKLGEHLPLPTSFDTESFSELRPFPLTVEEAYRRWLFHGPCLQGITKIEGIGKEAICGVIQPSTPAQCFCRKVTGQWLIDPVLLDSAFQLSILLIRNKFDMTPLPAGLEAYRRFGSSPNSPVRCYVTLRSEPGGQLLFTNYHIVGANNRVVASLKEMEVHCSKALNRLSGTQKRNN
jgi:NAD(P)-dependent dehydrogenase (short-subunit alcohol dehydrogenase family)